MNGRTNGRMYKVTPIYPFLNSVYGGIISNREFHISLCFTSNKNTCDKLSNEWSLHFSFASLKGKTLQFCFSCCCLKWYHIYQLSISSTHYNCRTSNILSEMKLIILQRPNWEHTNYINKYGIFLRKSHILPGT